MEESNTSVKSISIKYGLISGLVGITFFVVINLVGLGMNQGVSWIGYLIMGAIIYLGHKAFKEEGDGYMSYGQGLGIGTLISFISSIISSAFFFVYISYINQGYVQKILDMTREKMEEQGNSDTQVDQAMEMTEKFMSPGMMVAFGVLGTVFFGFIISLIVSAITQNKQPESELI